MLLVQKKWKVCLDGCELAAIFTVQTAGEALNCHPHLNGLLANGYWKDGVFTRFSEVDLQVVEPPTLVYPRF